MEITLPAELEKRLDDLAALTGRPPRELVEDALDGYLSELAETRDMLDERFDEVETGRVELIDGEEAFRILMEKSALRRSDKRPA